MNRKWFDRKLTRPRWAALWGHLILDAAEGLSHLAVEVLSAVRAEAARQSCSTRPATRLVDPLAASKRRSPVCRTGGDVGHLPEPTQTPCRRAHSCKSRYRSF